MARKLPAMIAEPPAVMLRGNGSMEFLHPFPIPWRATTTGCRSKSRDESRVGEHNRPLCGEA